MVVPTFDQIPAYLAGLAEELKSIKDILPQLQAPGSQGVEQPTNVQGAAEFTGLDEQTIYRKVRLKEIPFHRKMNRLYFYKSELNQWIKEGNIPLREAGEEAFLKANTRKKRGSR